MTRKSQGPWLLMILGFSSVTAGALPTAPSPTGAPAETHVPDVQFFKVPAINPTKQTHPALVLPEIHPAAVPLALPAKMNKALSL